MSTLSRAALAGALITAVALPAGASAATRVVGAGPPLAKAPPGTPQYADAVQFFPARATVHVGDTVTWKFHGFHSVYFPKKGGKNVALFMPDATRTVDEQDPAGSPFSFNGRPQFIANPAAAFPLGGKTENGRLPSGSGVPRSQRFSYALKFTKAGAYTYYCTIHPHMKGVVRVLPKRAKVPSAAADAKAIAKQITKVVTEVKKNVRRPDASGNVVQAGRDTNGISLLNFFPAEKTVSVGSTVDFRMSRHTNEVHTVTFATDPLLAHGGFVDTLESRVFAPLPGTGKHGPPVIGLPGAVFYPSDPGALSYDGSQHGGFLSVGLMGEAPLPTHDTVTFTKPGTYTYVCLIHPEMKGKIIVR